MIKPTEEEKKNNYFDILERKNWSVLKLVNCKFQHLLENVDGIFSVNMKRKKKRFYKSCISLNFVRNDKLNHDLGWRLERILLRPCIFCGKGNPRSTHNTHLQTKGGGEIDVKMIAAVCMCLFACVRTYICIIVHVAFKKI